MYSPPQGPSIPTALKSNNKAVSYQAQGAVSAPLTSCYRAVFPNCSDGQWGETVPRDGFQNVPRDSIGNLFFGSVFLDCPPYPAILSSSRVRLKQSGSEPRSRLPWRTGHVQGKYTGGHLSPSWPKVQLKTFVHVDTMWTPILRLTATVSPFLRCLSWTR